MIANATPPMEPDTLDDIERCRTLVENGGAHKDPILLDQGWPPGNWAEEDLAVVRVQTELGPGLQTQPSAHGLRDDDAAEFVEDDVHALLWHVNLPIVK